eukprot:c31265_g1_i1 orf=2-181(-)
MSIRAVTIIVLSHKKQLCCIQKSMLAHLSTSSHTIDIHVYKSNTSTILSRSNPIAFKTIR